jgi:hypothetical protein
VRELKNDLDQRGIVSAVKLSRKGRRRGGKPFSRGALYCLLSNRIYLGEIRHKQQSHPGQHEPIMSRELWERVQAKLCGHAVRDGEGRKTAAMRSPLAGKLFDANGEPLYVQGAVKGSTTLSLLRFQAAGKRRVTGTGTAVAAIRSRDRASSLSWRPDDAR